MCMKYEHSYKGCFDYMFFDVFPDQNIERFFEEEWGITTADSERVRYDLFALIEKWHEEGIITPLTDDNARFKEQDND